MTPFMLLEMTSGESDQEARTKTCSVGDFDDLQKDFQFIWLSAENEFEKNMVCALCTVASFKKTAYVHRWNGLLRKKRSKSWPYTSGFNNFEKLISTLTTMIPHTIYSGHQAPIFWGFGVRTMLCLVNFVLGSLNWPVADSAQSLTSLISSLIKVAS